MARTSVLNRTGGYFDYRQDTINYLINEIEHLILTNDDDSEDEWGSRLGRGFEKETTDEFREAVKYLRTALTYVNRVDRLASRNESEETFLRELAKDLSKMGART